MGKKIPILISTLITVMASSLFGVTPTFAEVVTDRGNQAWSIAEMEELYYKTKAKDEETCGKDRDCRFQLEEARMGVPIYEALRMYSMSTFVMSAVNPSTNTVRAYFRDLDTMMMEMEFEEVHIPLTEAYIVWVDSEYGGNDYSFLEEMRSGVPTQGLHEIYKASTELNGANWFPVETEVEITAPEAHLELNTEGKIRLFGLNFPSSVMSWIDYSDCLNSPRYQDGMECRIMYDETGNHTYVPFWPEENIEADAPQNPDSPSTETEPQITQQAVENQMTDAHNTVEYVLAVIGDNSTHETRNELPNNINNADNNITIDSPESAKQSTDQTAEDIKAEPLSIVQDGVKLPTSGERCNSQNNFPWWLIVLIILGNVLIWWFFGPKLKKSVDKKNKTR